MTPGGNIEENLCLRFDNETSPDYSFDTIVAIVPTMAQSSGVSSSTADQVVATMFAHDNMRKSMSADYTGYRKYARFLSIHYFDYKPNKSIAMESVLSLDSTWTEASNAEH
jgi:hypothetical protein